MVAAAPIAAAAYTATYRVGFDLEQDIIFIKSGPGILSYETHVIGGTIRTEIRVSATS